MKKLLWWLIAGSKGGVSRARIIDALAERPYNANQLAELLDLDYKTVRHHLGVLEKNSVIISHGGGYGKVYFLTGQMEENLGAFREIWRQIGQK